MANLDELIQKLSEKSKALTYDSGRWDSTQLAKKTKELTELLPEILNGIIDAIPAPAEILSFAAPLEKSGTDVSLQIGGGLEKDSDDALAVKLATDGGLKATTGGIKNDFIATIPQETGATPVSFPGYSNKITLLITPDGDGYYYPFLPITTKLALFIESVTGGTIEPVRVFGFIKESTNAGENLDTADIYVISVDNGHFFISYYEL